MEINPEDLFLHQEKLEANVLKEHTTTEGCVKKEDVKMEMKKWRIKMKNEKHGLYITDIP